MLDDGAVSGVGTHEELLKNNAIYRKYTNPSRSPQTAKEVTQNEQQQKTGGPGGPRGMRKGPKAKNPMKTLKRIFAIIVKGYPIQCVLVIIGIVVGVLANVYGSLFLQSLIDDYITPLVEAPRRISHRF